MNPEDLFYSEKVVSDKKINCNNFLIIPGYVDVQINGGFGYDFSSSSEKVEESLNVVAKGILQHGVTSFCPTLVTSESEFYKQALPKLKKRCGGKAGAEIVGAHVEGPYINISKKGAHNPEYVQKDGAENGLDSLVKCYGSLENIALITLAPELPGILDLIPHLVDQNITVSIGHSMANFSIAEDAVCMGASLITHLFNAMLPFHHRDPGIVGVLTSLVTPKPVSYGLIADGIHTHSTALRIAYRSHPHGAVIVTDAIAALGLPPGIHKLGSMDVEITDRDAKIVGTETLAGSINSMDEGVRHFLEATGCTIVEAVNAATLHPARVLGISHNKGTLEYGSDADFLLLDDKLYVQATFIAGEPVWMKEGVIRERLSAAYQ